MSATLQVLDAPDCDHCTGTATVAEVEGQNVEYFACERHESRINGTHRVSTDAGKLRHYYTELSAGRGI